METRSSLKLAAVALVCCILSLPLMGVLRPGGENVPLLTALPIVPPPKEPTVHQLVQVAAGKVVAPETQGVPTYVRVSHYWPPLGGVNCANFRDGVCISKTASGEPWEDWVDRGCACPSEWPFGTIVVIGDKTWICKDRGGKIVFKDGVAWVDLLQHNADYTYGAIVPAVVQIPSH